MALHPARAATVLADLHPARSALNPAREALHQCVLPCIQRELPGIQSARPSIQRAKSGIQRARTRATGCVRERVCFPRGTVGNSTIFLGQHNIVNNEKTDTIIYK